MPTYTTYSKVNADLPSGHGILEATIDTYISEASDEVEVRVGKKYARQYKTSTQKFPDITDSPATPSLIEKCCRWLVLAECYEDLGQDNRGDEQTEGNLPEKVYYRRKAEKVLKEIATDDTMDLNVSVENKFWSQEKYPDDESDYDRIFTNENLDSYTYD